MLGEPYSLGGLWSYPKEEFGRTRPAWRPCCRTGVPAAAPPMARSSTPACWSGAHRTLQLPAIVTSGTWRPGWRCKVRVNDRGPPPPGRVIGLSARAADAARHPGRRHRPGADDGGGRAEPRAGPRPADTERGGAQVEAAPTATVERETLAPLPGAQQATRLREAPRGRQAVDGGRCRRRIAARPAARGDGASAPPCPAGSSWKPAPSSAATWRQRQAQRIGGRVEPFGEGRMPQYRVRLGPYARMSPAADRAVAAVLAAGCRRLSCWSNERRRSTTA